MNTQPKVQGEDACDVETLRKANRCKCDCCQKTRRQNQYDKTRINQDTILGSTLQVVRLLGFLRIFLYNAKPSFEIAKWMAKHMLWQNMKINKIMQKT